MWNSEFLIKVIVSWLFIQIITVSNLFNFSSLSNFFIQTAFFVVSVKVMYFTLWKNKTTIFWHFELQNTDLLIILNTYSDVNLLNLRSFPQSESKYFSNLSWSLNLYLRTTSKISYTYQNTHFRVFQCVLLGLCANWLRVDIIYVMLSWICVIMYIKDFIIF